jgi:hypothetical protein
MKGIMRICVVVFVFVGLCALGLAQAEKPKGQLYFVEEVVVKLDKFSDYDAAVKEAVELAKKHSYPHSWVAYSTNEMHYYFVYPIKSESDIEALFEAWGEMVAKIGEEKWQALYDRLNESVEYYKYFEIQHLPLQSYAPGDLAITPMEAPAAYWGFCYVKPGHTKSLMELFNKYVELYKSKNIPAGFESYVALTGADLPAYFYVLRGKSFTDLFGKSDKAHEMAEAEMTTLWEKLTSHLRKYEYKLGMFRPDLSYMPEQK